MAGAHDESSLDEPLVGRTSGHTERINGFSMSNSQDIVYAASLAEKKRLWWRNALLNMVFIGSWFLFSTILSFYNKWMFSAENFGFPYPLFVTTLHFFVQFLLAALLRTIWPKRFIPQGRPSKSDYGVKIAPTAIATGLDVGLSNLSLKTISLSFFTMCKSSSLIFVLLFAFLFRLEKFSLRLVGVIALTFSGVVLMVATETHFVLVGLILVLIASALGGFRWALTQLLLKNKKMGMDHPVATIFWLSPVMGLTLGIISMVLDDWSSLLGSKFFTGFETVKTIFFLVTPGVIAFCMVLSEFTIIQRAGIVPMSIAGIAKEVTTISMSAVVFGDPLTFLNMVGVAVTICGIALFTYHKYRKSLESDLPLDAHGNPVDLDDSTAESQLLSHELDETARLTRDSDEYDSDDDGLSTNHTRTLFSADEDQDAEELRSIRSSKLAWNTGRAGREEPSAAP